MPGVSHSPEACETARPAPHSVWPPPSPRHSDSRVSWAAVRSGSPGAAWRLTALPPHRSAAGSRGSLRAPATPRASRARGPDLLHPSDGPDFEHLPTYVCHWINRAKGLVLVRSLLPSPIEDDEKRPRAGD